jgi:hypothetical protein
MDELSNSKHANGSNNLENRNGSFMAYRETLTLGTILNDAKRYNSK